MIETALLSRSIVKDYYLLCSRFIRQHKPHATRPVIADAQ